MNLVVNNVQTRSKSINNDAGNLKKLSFLLNKIESGALSEEEDAAAFAKALSLMINATQNNIEREKAREKELAKIAAKHEEVGKNLDAIVQMNLWAQEFLKERGLWDDFRDFWVLKKMKEEDEDARS